MPSIQTRVFRRIATNSLGLDQAIRDVTVEVNAFLLGLPNLGDALDIQTTIAYLGQSVAYAVTLTYIES